MEGAENVLEIFGASNTSMQTNFWVALIAALVGLGAMLYLLKRSTEGSNRNRFIIGAMLAFFVCMIGTGTVLLSWITIQKIGPVTLYEDAIETGYGRAELVSIKRIFFHEDVQRSMLNSELERATIRFLIIEERSGKNHALSEENYEINKIYGKLKQVLDKKE